VSCRLGAATRDHVAGIRPPIDGDRRSSGAGLARCQLCRPARDGSGGIYDQLYRLSRSG